MSAGTDGYGYGCPRVRMGTDIASAGTDGHGYNSHTRAALYFRNNVEPHYTLFNGEM